MKKPIIFLSVFLVLYTLNILFLYKTSGVSLIPAPQEHSQNAMPLSAKASSTFNPIPLSLIKDSPAKPNSRYVKPKEGVVRVNVPPAAPIHKESVAKTEIKTAAPPVKDFSKNTPDFAPNPPAGYVPPVQAQQPPAPAPVPSPATVQAEQPKPIIKEEAKPAPKKEEPKIKQVKPEPVKYKEIVDTAANNSVGKDAAFVMIQDDAAQKTKPAVKTAVEAKKLPAKQAVTKELPKPQEVKQPAPAPVAPVVQEAPKPTPAPAVQKPENSAKLMAADLVDIESLPIQVFLDIRYATTNNFTGKKLYSSSKCYLNKNVAQAFVKAVFYAQAEGLYLRIYDCYRPSSVQQLMWDKEDSGKFLSSPEKGSNHSRGGAIDLGLCDSSGKPLPAPTGFDDFTDDAAFNAKEGLSEEAIKNRTKLQEIMKKAGFNTIKNEWWHFDYKDAKSYPLLDIAI